MIYIGKWIINMKCPKCSDELIEREVAFYYSGIYFALPFCYKCNIVCPSDDFIPHISKLFEALECD